MTTTLRDPRWSPARSCARCGENPGPDLMVYSRHTGAWYCGDPDACTSRVAAPVDPEYADVDEAGQLALGVPGEQRSLDGLAPTCPAF